MRAGVFDRIVQFRRAQFVQGDLTSGYKWNDEDPESDNHGDPHPASKRDLSDGERWRAAEVQSHVTARFVLRWSPFTAGITPRDRLVCEGTVYEITGIKEGANRRQTLEFSCAARNDMSWQG